MERNLTPTLTIRTCDPFEDVEILTPHGMIRMSRQDWDVLCDSAIDAYKADPQAYELYKQAR